MLNITLENGNFQKTHFIDEKDLFMYIIELLQDKEDVNNVLKEIEKKEDGVDYSVIRNSYV